MRTLPVAKAQVNNYLCPDVMGKLFSPGNDLPMVNAKKTQKPPKRKEPEITLEHLGAWVRQSGKRQNVIADAAGIGESHLSLAMAGKRGVSMLAAARLAKALGIGRDEILRAPGPGPTPNVISLDEFDEGERRIIRNMVEGIRRGRLAS